MKENRITAGRLKIAMIIDAYDECKNGAAISTKRFVNLLRPEHEVILVTTGEAGPGRVVLPKFYPPFVSHVMKRMKTPLAIPVNRKLRKIIRDADIVHVQFPFLLAIHAVRVARKLGVPVVATFHIQAEHLAMNAGIRAKWFIRGCYQVWLKYIYNLADLVICPSRFAQDELKRYGLLAPSVIISNGILPVYKPLNVRRKPEWAGKFIILSVGRFAPEKRHRMIISAIRRSKHRDNIQLILIGEGPLKENLQELGNDLPNKPVFLALQAEELIYYYNISDLYVHAASIEIEGMTILEAMGCGLPLLVADGPKSAANQFALDDRSLFNSTDTADLVNKIDYWIEHPDQLKEKRKLYHENALNYRIENSYRQLVDNYQGIVNGRRGSLISPARLALADQSGQAE